MTAEYFQGTDFQGKFSTRTEKWINYDPANVPPDPMVPKDPMSARWTATIRPPFTGEYAFSMFVDDACRLVIDGKELFGFDHRSLSNEARSIYLEAGKDYEIVVEYFNDRDNAIAQLKWRLPQVGNKERIELYGKAGQLAR